MEIETVQIATLRPPPRNVRTHPEKQIAELARAVEMFGQTRPIVIDEDNTVLVGNGLVAAMRRIGRSELDATRMAGLSQTDKWKLMLSDNRLFELGLDDHNAIMEVLKGMGGDYDIPGFDPEILKSLHSDIETVSDGAFDSYGILPEAAVADARENELPAPVPGAPPPAGPAHDEVACPQCGGRFARP